MPDEYIGDIVPRMRLPAARQRNLDKMVSAISAMAYWMYANGKVGDRDIAGELAQYLDRLKLQKPSGGTFYTAADAAEVAALMMAAVVAAETEGPDDIWNADGDMVELTWAEFQYYILNSAIEAEEGGNVPTYAWKPGANTEWDVVLEGRDADGARTLVLPITRLGNIEDTAEIKDAPEEEDYIPLVDTADGGQMKKVPVAALVEQARQGLTATGFVAGTVAPENTGLLWIDTTEGTGGLKYHNGTEWVHVPVAYT